MLPYDPTWARVSSDFDLRGGRNISQFLLRRPPLIHVSLNNHPLVCFFFQNPTNECPRSRFPRINTQAIMILSPTESVS